MAPANTFADMLNALEQLSPEERIQAILSYRAPEDDKRFYSPWSEGQVTLKEIQKISPHRTLVTFAFKVDRFFCNSSNNLHGGAQATLFDIATSVAIQAFGKKDFWLNGGVSRVLSVTYVRPAPEGTELLLECEIVHMGQKLSLSRAILKRADDGAIVSTCEHNKAAVPSKPGWGKL